MGAAAKLAKYEGAMRPREWNKATEELIRLSVRSDQTKTQEPAKTKKSGG